MLRGLRAALKGLGRRISTRLRPALRFPRAGACVLATALCVGAAVARPLHFEGQEPPAKNKSEKKAKKMHVLTKESFRRVMLDGKPKILFFPDMK